MCATENKKTDAREGYNSSMSCHAMSCHVMYVFCPPSLWNVPVGRTDRCAAWRLGRVHGYFTLSGEELLSDVNARQHDKTVGVG